MKPEVLTSLLTQRRFHVETLLGSNPELVDIPNAIHPAIAEKLRAKGIEQLYSHQAEAVNHAFAGKNVLVTTGTGSGKSLCYNLPVIHTLLSEPAAKALYLFPTKALAHDQTSALDEFLQGTGLRASTYDGDTLKSQRSVIRKNAHIILTNPDMLHVGILPQHEHWARFWRSLRFIVIDEAHVYRGIFGGHFSWIVRRLQRLSKWYGQGAQIISASATVQNPEKLFEQLTGQGCELVNKDGGRKGTRTFVFVEPQDEEVAEMISPNVETGKLLAEAVEHRVKSLAFCKARGSTELVLRYAKEELDIRGMNQQLVESYRGGYTPKERREIEQKFFKGQIDGLVSTNAMELGVDVGELDLVILNGYPGRKSSFFQQMGRAGRSGKNSLGILLSHPDPLERFLVQQPKHLLGGTPEPSIPSLHNKYIVASQLKCMAYERPISVNEAKALGVLEQLNELADSGELAFSAGLYTYPSYSSPSLHVNIRGMDGAQILLKHGDEELGTMERWRAFEYAHEGAIYLHRGETYLVNSLDLESEIAHVKPVNSDYYTVPVVQTLIENKLEIASRKLKSMTLSLQSVDVTTFIPAYRKKRLHGLGVMEECELELPPQTFQTFAVRLDFDDLDISDMSVIGALHGLEHALVAVAPVIAGCDRRDLGSAWSTTSSDSFSPMVAVYDDAPGGTGLAEALFENWTEWVKSADELVNSCPCEFGCPLCLLSPHCEAGNELLNKSGVLGVLKQAQHLRAM